MSPRLVAAVWIVCQAACVTFASPPNLSPPVNTNNGILIGHKVSANGVDVYEFDGIPYAEAPVGPFRFKKTQPKVRWPNALLTIFPPPACPQVVPTPFGPSFPGLAVMRTNTTMTEDCLYLNIWVPRTGLDPLYYHNGDSINRTAAPQNWPLLPVLVYFHGGGFVMGSTQNNLFNGTVFSGLNNIIVVTVQSRLGALGYFYVASDEAPGNMGLWDQHEALQWIHDNIAVFGGNSSQVTIAGQGSGGASIAYHLLSPYSRRFFQRAILESGTALSDWATSTPSEARARSNKLAQILSVECPPEPIQPISVIKSCPNCPGFYPQHQQQLHQQQQQQLNFALARMNCLRSLDAMKFAQRQFEVLQKDDSGSAGLFAYAFTPVIDGDFVPRNPRDMLMSNDFYNVSILAGINKDEGSLFVQMSTQGLKLLPNPLILNRTFDNFDSVAYEGLIQSYFSFYPRNGIVTFPVVQEGIRLIYESLVEDGEILSGKGVIDKVVQAVGDWGISCPTISWGDAYADAPDEYRIKTFFYYFSQRSSQNVWPEWAGVMNAEEVPFVFGEPFADYAVKMTYTEEEKLLSRVMMAYWSNFAKFGDPNRPDTSSRNQAASLSLRPWPAYDGSTGKIVANINVETRVRQTGDASIFGLKRKECAFWSFLSRVHAAISIAQQCGRQVDNKADMFLLANFLLGATDAPATARQQSPARGRTN